MARKPKLLLHPVQDLRKLYCEKKVGGKLLIRFPPTRCRRNKIYLSLFSFSSNAFPGLNFTLIRGGIIHDSPVRGLRPSRGACFQMDKVPKF